MGAEESFPAWLRRQLLRRDWKSAELSRRSGVSSATVSRWVNGLEVPSPESCIRIAEVLNVDSDDVLGLAGHRIPTRPVAPDDPATRLSRLLKRVRWNGDRAKTIEAILETYLETDRESPRNRFLPAA